MEAQQRHKEASRQAESAFEELADAFRQHVRNLASASDGFYSSLGDKRGGD